MQWFSALIPAYPEIQAKAHEELDRVVGRNRLPTCEDEKNMPYIHAIIKVGDVLPTFFNLVLNPISRKLNVATIRSGLVLLMSTPKISLTVEASFPRIPFSS